MSENKKDEKKPADGGELSDDDLAKVSGGTGNNRDDGEKPERPVRPIKDPSGPRQ